MRTVLNGIPSDKITRTHIHTVNRINIFGFFVLVNLFFYNDHLYSFVANLCVIQVAE